MASDDAAPFGGGFKYTSDANVALAPGTSSGDALMYQTLLSIERLLTQIHYELRMARPRPDVRAA